MRRRNLYKYFSERKWAEAFINGEVLFRSLSYFRDYEDNSVREDHNEGTSIYRPEGGLIVNKPSRHLPTARVPTGVFGGRLMLAGGSRALLSWRRGLFLR